MTSRWFAVVVDARDPDRLAHWWADVLGCRVDHAEDGASAVRGERQPALRFVPTDRGGAVAGRRLGMELSAEDHAAEVERLVNMGARHAGGPGAPSRDVVLADPEGNEFTVVAAAAS